MAKRSEHATMHLTGREADAVSTLLHMVLTNPDQWASLDLQALRRTSDKLGAGLRAAVGR